jgi:hypothetical protein
MSGVFITAGAGAGLGIPITVSIPLFPNVPQLPGVPQLARSLLFAAFLAPTIALPATGPVLAQAQQTPELWGVLDDKGNVAINADSVQDFGWRQEYRISNFPVQQGQFASYNKVTLPFESSIVLTKGGSVNDRFDFLAQVDRVAASLTLYTILTPEKAYLDVNVTRAELQRRGTANAYYFDVELFFTQVVQVAAQYSSSNANGVTTSTETSSVPSAVRPVNQGLNNPQTPSSAVQSATVAAITPPKPTG